MRNITIEFQDIVLGFGLIIVVLQQYYSSVGWVMIGFGLGYDAKPSIQRIALAFSLYMKRGR